MQRKVDYAALEREFVTGDDDVSQRSLAKREGISNGTLSEYARKHDWKGKRAEYRTQETSRFIQRSADDNARRLARLADRSVDVLEAMLVRLAQQLVGDEERGIEPMSIPAKEGLEAIKVIQLLRGGPTERTEENVRGFNVHTIDPRLLGALEDLARRNVEPRRVGGEEPLALTGRVSGAAESRSDRESA